MTLSNKKYLRLSTGLGLVMALAVVTANYTQAADTKPEDGEVVRGEATIDYNGLNTTINQNSLKAIINWDSFSVGEAGSVVFNQTGADAVTLNRVTGDGVSNILGSITAPGHVFLINRNGIIFGEGSTINVGGLVASTFDISDNNFWSGNYLFDKAGVASASVENFGSITIKEGGLAAFVAPYVANSGVINARLGSVSLGASETGFALDFYGDGLIKFVVQEETQARLGLGEDSLVGVDVSGSILADGGIVAITADVAREVVSDILTIGGEIRANSIEEREGKIILSGPDNGRIRMSEDATLDASGTHGGSIEVDGDVVLLDGVLDASGDAAEYNDALSYLYGIGAQQSIIDTVLARANGGNISVNSNWFSLGGVLDVSGANGGNIDINVGGFSNTGVSLAIGQQGGGGNISFDVDTTVLEFNMAYTDASGLVDGGSISMLAGHQITSSGTYVADGLLGNGGNIDVSASVTKSLSARYGARGGIDGGRIRFGGEFQGGKNLAEGTDELANADVTIVSSGSLFDVTGGGTDGIGGGEVIIWSDDKTIFQGLITGDGAFVEVSSAGDLEFVGDVEIGDGELLLDPKNLIITELFGTPSLSLILGYQYSDVQQEAGTWIESFDNFGVRVALDGDHLAVGAMMDKGADNATSSAGAVYLFTFIAGDMSQPVLSAIIGADYTGGNNIDNTSIEAGDTFGYGLALEGNKLAVGAANDDGFGNGAIFSGAVYLYTFTDNFNSITEVAVIGSGYTVGENVDVGPLDLGDAFGTNIGLSGNLLAIGASGDDGNANGLTDSGAVYLFSFTGDFTSITQQAIIGSGYAGTNDLDHTGLEASDRFGSAVALDGTLLAAGSPSDDGSGNGVSAAGAVYLYSFTGNFTSITQQAIIGADYAGTNDVDNTALEINDFFGSSIALDGTHLAISATGDDGSGNGVSGSGAVYLYSFAGDFTSITQQAIIGADYTSGNNVDNHHLDGDAFGRSLALDGGRLVVGTFSDDGADNSSTDSGAVYLYSYTGDFTNITHEDTIGYGYATDISLDVDDYFGRSLALRGSLLAVGASGDDGIGNATTYAGAVYLFTFIGSDLTNPILSGIIGQGYTGGNNVDNTALASGDVFGAAVALDGNHLAVGATGDDGSGNGVPTSGAVYLYSFTDNFKAITLEAIIGADYAGTNDLDNTSLQPSDQFGVSVALDGTHLAVGAFSDDGSADDVLTGGAVYLYSFTGDFTSITQQAIIGSDYSGGNNFDVASIESSDYFGSSVALDGTLLAVGAWRDSGIYSSAYGAVYLFSFTGDFTGITQEAIIGQGYSGGNNVNNNWLGDQDQFGYSVALDGNLLAVGAPSDDGYTGGWNNGKVYLYSFTGNFTSITLESHVGWNFTGTNDVHNSSLEYSDKFGSAIALDGTNLVISAKDDDGGDNSVENSGAVYLYSFTGNFTDITWQETLGHGQEINFDLGVGDRFGSSVALDGKHLAVGVSSDDGVGDGVPSVGAVYLYTFLGDDLKNPILSAIIGDGYSGGNNIDNTSLGFADIFGASVALEGDLLAVGAVGDDGSADGVTDAGAVYLYSFTGDFSYITERAIIGSGYTNSGDVDNTALGASDYFGRSVALDGSLLAVGADGDDGAADGVSDAGALYIYSFSGNFASLNQEMVIGSGYSGANAVDNTSLEAGDQFGYSVALDSPLIAVGAISDDGSFDDTPNAGAVYLYSYINDLTTITQRAIIGVDYSGGNNIDNTAIQSADRFGYSVALDGTHLGVGAPLDDGFNNNVSNSGSVYLYSFAGSFNALSLEATIGADYTGGNNVDETFVEANDEFGRSISLDGNNLAVGAMGDDGSDNSLLTMGAVYLYENVFAPVTGATGWNFADDTGATSIVDVNQITDILNAGTNVTLQASNDITLNTDLIVANLSGYGGTLTLQSGRSILINGNVTTDHGSLTFVANDIAANGVVNADRDAGAAAITMASGTSIDTGTGAFKATLSTGAGNTNLTSGDITLTDVTSETILVENLGASNGDVILNGVLYATEAAGFTTPLVVASLGGNFINNVGAGALVVEDTGEDYNRWLVYSQNPTDNTNGGLDGIQWYNTTYNSAAPTTINDFTDSNRFVYTQTATLLITADDVSRDYGLANPTFTTTITGFVNGETDAIMSGSAATPTTTATATTNVGTAVITPGYGSLSDRYNYQASLVNGTLTIDPATLTVTADDASRTYGEANPTLTSSITGFMNGETSSVLSGAAGTPSTTATATTNAGTTAITIDTGTLSATNYVFVAADGTLTINKATLTVTVGDETRVYGDATEIFNVNVTGFVNGEDISVASNLTLSSNATATSDVGTYALSGSDATADNYTFTYVDGALTITKARLTIVGADATSTYGTVRTDYDYSVTGFLNGDDASVITGAVIFDLDPNYSATSAAGSQFEIDTNALGLASTNYTFTGVDLILTVEKAPLTVTLGDDSKTYDGLAYSGGNGITYTGLANGETEAVLGDVLSFGGTAQGSVNAGTYTITLEGLTSTNYTITFVDGALTTDKAALSVTANDDSKIADGVAYSGGNGVVYAGFVNSETDTVLGGDVTYSGTSQGAVDADTYVITPEGQTSDNYTITYVDGTLTIEAGAGGDGGDGGSDDPADPVNDPVPPAPPVSDPPVDTSTDSLPDNSPAPTAQVVSSGSVLVVANAVTEEITITSNVISVELPDGIFDHEDDTATYTVTATLPNGEPLPEWLSYDAETNTLTGVVPEGFSGEIDVLLTAEDAQQNTAQTVVKINVTSEG